MTTYDRDKDEWTVMVGINITLPVYVQGSDDAVEARFDALKAIQSMLATKLDSMELSGSDWPIHPVVRLGLAEPDALEVGVI